MDSPPRPARPAVDPSGRWPTWVPLLFVVLAVALVAAGGAAVVLNGREDGGGRPSAIAPSSTSLPPVPASTDPAPLPAPIAPTGDATFDEAATEVARFVEQQRGHPFLTPVDVALLDDAAFRERLTVDFDTTVPDLRSEGRVLKSLGLIPADLDFVDVTRTEQTEGVLGFYDPTTSELVVRGGGLTPFTKTTLAHELTHALDDQWFDLDRASLEAQDEPSFGFHALAEGSATWVEDAYLDAMSGRDRTAYEQEAGEFGAAMDLSGVPPVIIELIESPYQLGETLVTRLVNIGGVARLDQAFRAPPISSEQVLHPERYESGDPSVEVPLPPADGPIVHDGSIGELTLAEMLSSAVAPAEARAAADGWQGDRFVAWSRADGSTCLRADIVAADRAERDELAASVRSWQYTQPDADSQSTGDTGVRLTACV